MSRQRTMRRGYILIVVLGLTAIVTTLGWAFLDTHSTVMPAAVNRQAATRAQYLAESGIDIGTHFLMYPPTTVAEGDYWTGATGIAIDATADYTNVSIVQDGGDEDLYMITALGVVHNPDGTVRAKHQIAAEVLVPEAKKWEIPFAWLGTHTAWLQSPFEIYGDIHSNGNIQAESWCDGALSAVGWVNWFGYGPVTSITEYTDPYLAPSADPSYYATYTVDGTEYTAFQYPKGEMGNADVDALNAAIDPATNPGRIILGPPGNNLNLVFDQSHVLNGTLVVDGSLEIGLDTVPNIVAVQNYPALVVAGEVFFNQDNAGLDVTGSILCGNVIWDNQKKGISMNVVGAVIAGRGLYLDEVDGLYTFTWDAARATFWNFEGAGEPKPITILSWQEN